MKILKTACVLLGCLLILLASNWKLRSSVEAQEAGNYVGTDTCVTCHKDVSKSWALTSHRRSLFNKDPSKTGCEACHGPGEEHVAEGGDTSKIVSFDNLKPQQIAAVCMDCHKQEHVTLWSTSLHARAKVTCIDCHDVHSPETAMMSKEISNGTVALEGLTTQIKDLQLAANTAPEGSAEKAATIAKIEELQAQAQAIRESVGEAETAYKRSAEPYVCYNCHKTEKVQMHMPSHHPIPENKMKCSDCHNPHGGPKGMLKEESVNETCFKCHAEKEGPFAFEHPPVSEDCSTCHNPHGSVQNDLLTQSEPFLCLKCHVHPHTRSNTLGRPEVIPQYLAECTDCHSQVHGSDEHSALHY